MDACGGNPTGTGTASSAGTSPASPGNVSDPEYSGTLAANGPYSLSCALCQDMAGCFSPRDGPLACPALNASACPRALPPLSPVARFEARQGVVVVAGADAASAPTLYQCPSRGLVVLDAGAASGLGLTSGSIVVSRQAGCVPSECLPCILQRHRGPWAVA